MSNKYLVQGSWLTELPTMSEPDFLGFNIDPDESKYQAQKENEYSSHLAHLKKICRCEGLKDGAIVEEGVDYKLRYEVFGTVSDNEWWPISKELYDAENESEKRTVAIPLHREQGDWREDLQRLKDKHGWNDPSPQSEQAGENRSKEEILDDCLGGRNRRYSPFDVAYRKQVYKAMDEYAAQSMFEIIAFKDLDGVHWMDMAGYFLGMGLTESDMLKNGAAIYAVRINGEVFTSNRTLS